MLYRDFGSTGERVSILGFGCMRLPIIDERRDRIDVPLATQMLHYAIDHGVNYVDTAFPYHGSSFESPGESEGFVGGALTGGYREKVLLATKLPPWGVESRADMDRILAGQLERLQTDRVDCYLMHGIGAETWSKLVGLGAIEFMETAKADGRIRYAGFSYHDDPPAFAPIVDAYDWDFCQIQYNFMDVDLQAGRAGLEYAAARGLGVIVMEPLKGGRLAGRTPAEVESLWDSSPVKRSPIEWALSFVWDDPRVSLLLSGMSTMAQVIENVEIAARAQAGSLSPAEHAVIEKVREAYQARTAVDCTDCRYCLPCPEGITIPMILNNVNNAALFDDLAAEMAAYRFELGAGHTAPASSCTECGQCEEACPQQIKVPQELAKAVELLGE